MNGLENESKRYREIIRRAKVIRERAAESLRRASRKRQEDVGAQADAAKKRRKLRRKD